MNNTELMKCPYGTTDTYVERISLGRGVVRFKAFHREKVVAQLHPKVTTFIGLTEQDALAQAEEYDRKLKEGRNNANAAIKRRD